MEYLKKYKYFFIVLLILLVLIVCFLKKDNDIIYEQPNIEIMENNYDNEQIEEVVEKNIMVDIKGAVKNPGVYELKENDRVINAIDLSGGLLENADTTKINLSKKLIDEMVIIIDTKKEETIKNECNCPIVEDSKKEDNNKDEVIDNTDNKEDLQDIQNDALIEEKNAEIKNDVTIDKETDIEKELEVEKDNQNKKISLNTATKEQLMTLPGIGESKALAIIEYRTNNLFKSIEEITNIKGIGNSIYENIKEYITI